MSARPPLAYRGVMWLAYRLLPLLAPRGSKLALGVEGRRHAHETLVEWGRVARDPDRPVVWFHAPSVGEGHQAAAVIEALRALRPEVQIVYTYFSPSAVRFAERLCCDVATYLPWDVPEVVDGVVEAVGPDLLVFTKTEVWPALVERAHARAVPVALVGGRATERSGRARWPARALLRPTWGRLAVVCAGSEDDARVFAGLGVQRRHVHVTGDPALDSAAERAAAADPEASYLAPFHRARKPTLVAGSTWPADEDTLLPAVESLRASVPDVRLVLAPHEPTADRVRELLARLERRGTRACTMSGVEGGGVSLDDCDAVVVDSVGLLAHLYTVADVAYVGGGFGAKGLHSVLEPAAASVPVLFGPRHGGDRVARALLEAGGAKIASDAGEMARALTEWLTRDQECRAAGSRAFTYIADHLGAAATTAALLEPLMK